MLVYSSKVYSSKMAALRKELSDVVISLHQQLLLMLPLMMWSSGDW